MSEEIVTQWDPFMWAERKTDCYDGEGCDELKPQWSTYCEGDKSGETFDEPLSLDPSQFPPGTKITVSIPVCPKCELNVELCKGSDCSFDWKDWELSEYS